MKQVSISVEVTYRATVSLKVSDKMFEKLEGADGMELDGHEIDEDLASVHSFLQDNIHEDDSFNWEVEIVDVSEDTEE